MRVVYCHCAYAQVVPKATKDAVLAGLLDAGTAFDSVPDLCELSAKRDPALGELLAPAGQGARVLACYPRAVKWLAHSAGVTLPDTTTVLNMRTGDPAELLAQVQEAPAS